MTRQPGEDDLQTSRPQNGPGSTQLIDQKAKSAAPIDRIQQGLAVDDDIADTLGTQKQQSSKENDQPSKSSAL